MNPNGLQNVALLSVMFGSFATLITFTNWSYHLCIALSFISTLPLGYAFKLNNKKEDSDK